MATQSNATKRKKILSTKIKKGTRLTLKELREYLRIMYPEYTPTTVTTQTELAEAINVSPRTVQRFISEGMPVSKDGVYDLVPIIRWLREKELKELEERSQNKWKDDHEKWKAKQAEVRYQKMVGELVPAEEVEEGRLKRVLAYKRQLVQLPHVLAPKVDNVNAREAYVIIEDCVNLILDRFSAPRSEEKKRGNKKSKNTTK